MRLPLYLLLLSALLLSACAHLDNGFMRSAEPLEKGEIRQFIGISSSYSYAPGLNFQPDSILVLNAREKRADLLVQFPQGLDIGLGHGLQIGWQASFSLGPGFRFRGFDETFPEMSRTLNLRGYLQKSFPFVDGLWIGFAPGILIHNEVWDSQLRHRLKYQGIGGEFPVTITQTHHTEGQKSSNSVTFRYTKLAVTSRLNVSGPEVWGQHEYEQPDQSIKRYALIYTHQVENSWTRIFMDLGVEFSLKNGLVVPIFGIKTIYDPHSLLKIGGKKGKTEKEG